jgi:hypothetical protein
MLNAIVEFFESIGRARAANALATYGHYDLAKEVMLKPEPEFEVHP